MKVAVVYNRSSNSVINLFGVPNREKYGLRSIKRITDALKAGGHQVIALEGDKDLIDRLEEFMPRVIKGERPGLVFNLSYGIQGQARYTHVPGILEMVGIPYVGSGPQAHSLALDKVVAKMVFRQHGLPTPDFAVLQPTGYEPPDLQYPLIVKPRGEAVSFGLKIVNDPDELAAAAKTIFDAFGQSVLVERYIEGREINVGLLGNSPPEVLPPVELSFGEGGPAIYTYEDKTHRSGREVSALCPAPISEQQAARAQELARHAFDALGCSDCARVDMRMDADGELYILEINSLPSLGAGGSYVKAAAQIGLDFPKLVNRMVEVASARYFGTPSPPRLERGRGDARSGVFQYLTERRDRIERQLRDWVAVDSRSSDAYGIHHAASLLDEQLRELGLAPVADLTDERSVWCWQSAAGLEDGTLLVGHLDVPLPRETPVQRFRRDPEWLYGEGIGTSRAPLVMLQFALRALRHQRRLRRLPLGVLYYADEGQQAQQSGERIRLAMKRAKRVLVLRPGNPGGYLLSRRRGLRSFGLKVEGRPQRMGASDRQRDPLYQLASNIPELSRLSSRKDRVAVGVVDLRSEAYPMMLPHRAEARVLLSYPTARAADALEEQLRERMHGGRMSWSLTRLSDRPAMPERRANQRLVKALAGVADEWEIPLKSESSLWPSVAGLAPSTTAAACGLGPVARDIYTSHEAVERISLVQRTLLLAQFLVKLLEEKR